MIFKRISTVAALLLSGGIFFSSTQADSAALEKHELKPGPDDGVIAFYTAALLKELHFSHLQFDDELSSHFLHRYFETLDPQHLHFLQSDIDEFSRYENRLDDMTLNRRQEADTTPGYEIFDRFLMRLGQRADFARELLDKDEFDFTTDRRIQIDRSEAPYPASLEEARKLWRDRLMAEYLEEKLGLADERKDAAEKSNTSEGEGTDAEVEPKSIREEVVDTLKRRYTRTEHMFSNWTADDVLQIYLTTLAQTFDPHSDYMNQEQLDNFAIGMNLALFGIGAQLISDDGYCTIMRLIPGGPAEKSKKLKVNDRIVAVAQGDGEPLDVVDMNLSKIVQYIRGPKGTEVRLTILPPPGSSSPERRVVSLIRDEIKLQDQEARAKLIEFPAQNGETRRLGVIDLPSFYASLGLGTKDGKPTPKSTTKDVARLIKRLEEEGIDGLILDLRRNGGGSLEEAVNLTGLFIKEGPVVQVKEWNGRISREYDDDGQVLYGGPMIVLTSRSSASASEIVAGALQDYGRALIVGDVSTHGKGTVQSLNKLEPYLRGKLSSATNDPGAIKLTIRKFYRVSGESTQRRGVEPDMVLPSVANHVENAGEASIENALPWDTIPPEDYEALDRVADFLPELNHRSEARVADSKDFDYIREDIARFEKTQEDKTVSLNEAERIRERDEIKAIQEARKKERQSRTPSLTSVYEFTLENLDQPGLPAPLGSAEEASAADEALADDAEAASAEDEGPEVDPVLDETERILLDYIQLFNGSKVLTADK